MTAAVAGVDGFSHPAALLHGGVRSGQSAFPQTARVVFAICDQADWSATVALRARSVRQVEVGPAGQEQDPVCALERLLLEHGRVCASEGQGDPVAVVSQPLKPCAGVRSKRWIHPHATEPGVQQPVIVLGVVNICSWPWTRLRRSAGVQIERAKRLDDRWRRQPNMRASNRTRGIGVHSVSHGAPHRPGLARGG